MSNFVKSWLTTIDNGSVNDQLTVALVTRDSWIIAILGDPGAVSRVGRKGGTKVFNAWKRSSRLLTRPDWLPLGIRGWIIARFFKRQCISLWREFSFCMVVTLSIHIWHGKAKSKSCKNVYCRSVNNRLPSDNSNLLGKWKKVPVSKSLKQITGNSKMGWEMNASNIMKKCTTIQNLINTHCWTLYLD